MTDFMIDDQYIYAFNSEIGSQTLSLFKLQFSQGEIFFDSHTCYEGKENKGVFFKLYPIKIYFIKK